MSYARISNVIENGQCKKERLHQTQAAVDMCLLSFRQFLYLFFFSFRTSTNYFRKHTFVKCGAIVNKANRVCFICFLYQSTFPNVYIAQIYLLNTCEIKLNNFSLEHHSAQRCIRLVRIYS